MGYGVVKLDRLNGRDLRSLAPVNEVTGAVRLGALLVDAVDVGQQRASGAVAQIGNLLAKWLQLVVGKPFGEFIAADLKLGLANALA